MNASINIKNLEDNTSEKYNVYDLENKNILTYKDDYGANCKLFILKDGIMIDRKAPSHHTRLILRGEGSCEVENAQGKLILGVKVLAFEKKDDSISIAYTVESQIFNLKITFWENI